MKLPEITMHGLQMSHSVNISKICWIILASSDRVLASTSVTFYPGLPERHITSVHAAQHDTLAPFCLHKATPGPDLTAKAQFHISDVT